MPLYGPREISRHISDMKSNNVEITHLSTIAFLLRRFASFHHRAMHVEQKTKLL